MLPIIGCLGGGTINRYEQLRVLKEVFGFDTFRPGQEEIVNSILAGRDTLALMPTGAGKSLCFQIPALVRGGLTIVVSPLIALMQDQVAALKLAGVAADAIHSSNSRSQNVAIWHRVAAGELKILYLSPERLMTERMLAALARLPVSLVAVDEAHCISQWGPSFRPEYEALGGLRDRFPGVPIAGFTATADEVTREDIRAKLMAPDAELYVSSFDRPNIQLSVEPKSGAKKQLLSFLDRHRGESGIVYCLSRRLADEYAVDLSASGIRALPYHAGMDAGTRTVNQDTFITEPGVVMVATIAFGMGIDKPDVRFVFHTDIPGGIEAYYQEIGRAGRDGLPAEACMLYGLADIRTRRMFIDEQSGNEGHQRREHARLNALLGYCEAPVCRRVTLLAYFGERIEPCGNCDICRNPVALLDATEDAQQILSAILQPRQIYGAGHIVDVLRGTLTEKVEKARHDGLASFGSGAHLSANDWRSIIRQLVAGDFLHIDVGGYGGLKATLKGRELQEGQGVFERRAETLRPKAKAARARGPDVIAAGLLDTAEIDLLEALKVLRRKLAEERAVPAYVIFSDRSLEDMARRRPETREAFAEVHGVGAAKLRDLAAPFLAAIAEYASLSG